jgi:hypothetical protein
MAWTVSIFLGCAFFLSGIGESNSANPACPDGPKAHFVKSGHYYLNPAKIQYASVDGDTLTVAFGPGVENRVTLREADAYAMRDWLELHAMPTSGAASGREQSKGVDRSLQKPSQGGNRTNNAPSGGSNGAKP